MDAPICERILFVVECDARVEVPIRIYAPQPGELNEWRCHFEIGWPEGSLARYASGRDSVQALELAMRMIGINLYTGEAHQSGRLECLIPGDGYGFPVTQNVRDLLVGADKTYF